MWDTILFWGTKIVLVGIVVIIIKYFTPLIEKSVRKLDSYFEKKGIEKLDITESTIKTISTAAKYALYSIGFLVILYIFDLKDVIAGILAAAGISGLAIGFAAKDIISNSLSGILLMFDRPFKIGDAIVVGGNEGYVEEITFRSTKLRSFDGKLITIPNSLILNKEVINYSANPIRRIELLYHLNLDADVKKAITTIRKRLELYDWIMRNPPSRVLISDINRFGVQLSVQAWIKNKNPEDLYNKKTELYLDLKNSLDAIKNVQG